MVLFFRHIPFVVNYTFNATPPERLQYKKRTLAFATDSRILSLDSACLANAVPSRVIRTGVITQAPTETGTFKPERILLEIHLNVALL